jgi:hypothetical protein
MNKFDAVAAELAALGLTIAVRPGEYVVNFRGGGDATAYFTDDLDEALDHGRALAAALAEATSQPKGPKNKRRRARRPMNATAQRRRWVRRKNRRGIRGALHRLRAEK